MEQGRRELLDSLVDIRQVKIDAQGDVSFGCGNVFSLLDRLPLTVCYTVFAVKVVQIHGSAQGTCISAFHAVGINTGSHQQITAHLLRQLGFG